MRNSIFVVLSAALISAASGVASAQNLDPTVVVDRAYEGKLMEVHKPVLEMAVPDTVMRFDLDFDYSVFANPYKGSYEFNPYLLSMKPSASGDMHRKFYFRAGAGYQLHPELDLVWSPNLGGKGFGMDVYARNRSFAGNYHDLSVPESTGVWKGYDAESSAGVRMTYDWKKGTLDFGAGYNGLLVGEEVRKRSYNAMDAYMHLASKDYSTAVDYRLDAKYRLAGDCVTGLENMPSLTEHAADVDAAVTFQTRGSVAAVGIGADYVAYQGLFHADAGQFHITPHYLYSRGPLALKAGVKVAVILGGNGLGGQYVSDSKEQYLYPDVTLELAIIRKALKFRLDAVGGNVIDTYSSLLGRNHHLWAGSAWPEKPLLDFTVERVNLSAGFEGRILSGFSYRLYAGYVNYANALLDYVAVDEGTSLRTAGVAYAPYSKCLLGAEAMWKSERLMVDFAMNYTSAWGDCFSSAIPYLLPSAFTGDLAVEYNWKRRVYAGIDCSFSTARSGAMYTVPFYADLGLYAEYFMNRRFSVWARGGNLLGMTVQRNPLYAEKGAYFTLGVCLNL